ncbi:hypothetical protein WDW86_22155 [Bdellovibrionota bacterium FG-2]
MADFDHSRNALEELYSSVDKLADQKLAKKTPAIAPQKNDSALEKRAKEVSTMELGQWPEVKKVMELQRRLRKILETKFNVEIYENTTRHC